MSMTTTTTSATLSAAEHKFKPATLGEELFLIHLKRDAHMHGDPESDDDFDSSPVVPRRKRAKSIGEELYEIHVRRSKGLTLDEDMVEEERYSKSEDELMDVPRESSSTREHELYLKNEPQVLKQVLKQESKDISSSEKATGQVIATMARASVK